ncbi:hypothetical protein [Streptomyces poonensis]|nr:hypothetical protein [Streptomyces poonensis]
MNLRPYGAASGPRRRLAWRDIDTWLPRAHSTNIWARPASGIAA